MVAMGPHLRAAAARVRRLAGAAAVAAAVSAAGCVQLPPMLQPEAPPDERAAIKINRNYRTPEAPPALEPLVADRVVVEKSQRKLMLLRGGRVLRTYAVALGKNPVGDKLREGDGRTPEGLYLLDWRNPESEFYRSIHISYPSPVDAAEARERGVDPGDNIMIHGLPERYAWLGERHVRVDWTNGCIAVTNAEMDEIWRAVDDGTLIEIKP